MAITVYHYEGCGTCRKARKWLEAQGVDHALHDLVDDPPSAEAIASLHARSGLPIRKLFNTHGRSYREGGFKDRLGDMDDAEAIAALAADGKLVKRPIVDAGDAVLVGFRADAWESALT